MVSYLRCLRALILHRTPVREKDRIVEAFTREEGRIRLFAPGVRHVTSRRAGHLEPFMETRLVVSRSSRGDTIREARVLRAFPRLRERLERLQLAYTLARLLREYTGEGIRDLSLYDAILRLFATADVPRPLPPLLVESAQAQLLKSLGALPDLYRCTHCRQPLRACAFSLRSSQRGFWCASCGGKSDALLTDVVKVLRLLMGNTVAPRSLRVPADVQRRLRAVLRSFFRSQQFGGRVHSST